MKPDFLVVGASRGGTSTLHELLSQSGAVQLPERKELHYFNDDRNYRRGLDWYTQQLGAKPGVRVAGEMSPPYFHHGIRIGTRGEHVWDASDDSAARIASCYPDVRIVLSLRNPVTRAYSQYIKNRWQGNEPEGLFETAIDLELAGRRPPTETPLCWLYKNHYRTHVERYLSLFGRERVLILIFEEWVKEPRVALADLEEFLGLPDYSLASGDEIKPRNQGRRISGVPAGINRLGARSRILRGLLRRFGSKEGYPPLPDATADRLADIFRDDVEYVERVVGRPIPAWRRTGIVR